MRGASEEQIEVMSGQSMKGMAGKHVKRCVVFSTWWMVRGWLKLTKSAREPSGL
jgi:hypothetical protein